MTCQQILDELKMMENENAKRIFLNHSAKVPILGVKVEYLKKRSIDGYFVPHFEHFTFSSFFTTIFASTKLVIWLNK
jgi:hypothetical protein